MWKYFSGCVRDTLQRSVHYFDVRCGAGLANNQGNCVVARREQGGPVERCPERQGCSGRADERKESHWQQQLHNSWFSAFTWSGCVVLGWYSTQLVQLNQKRRAWAEALQRSRRDCPLSRAAGAGALLSSQALHYTSRAHYAFAQPINKLHNKYQHEHFNAHNVSNDADPGTAQISEAKSEAAVGELVEVTSYIENKLGVAAMDHGDPRAGLALLKTAAERNYGPALYNMALCYELGIGVKKDEKMATQLYHSAVSRNHPTAMYNLALLYGQGRGGLRRDTVLAEHLLRQAASHGNPSAAQALRTMDTHAQQQPPHAVRDKCHTTSSANPTQTFLHLIAN